MDPITIKYSAYLKAIPPQPIRLHNANWSGAPEKMEDGSEPQPWHCLPFVEGSTYGLELLYPYEKECQVVAENGTMHFEWDFANEPGGGLTGGEFLRFSPVEGYQFYIFNTRLDLQPPPGYVLRIEPHPRFFTDNTGTVPLALIGHLQAEWFPHMLFTVMRAPPQGKRHIFRKGEPYAQVLFVPHRLKYALVPMTPEEAEERRNLEHTIEASRLDIAENVWHTRAGYAFDNHYKVLARAFARDGMEGVKELVQKAADRQQESLLKAKTLAECMALGAQRIREQKYVQAEEIYTHLLARDPNNATVHNALGICYSQVGNKKHALREMSQAVALQPLSANYHFNLGELLRTLGRLGEAETSFRTALALVPNDPEILQYLGFTLAEQGRVDEAFNAMRTALAGGAPIPGAHYGIGKILAQQGDYGEARKCFEAALALAPTYVQARQALQNLPGSR